MTPIIIDKDAGRELQRVKECETHCDIKPTTWTTYTAHGRTPNPIADLDQRGPSGV